MPGPRSNHFADMHSEFPLRIVVSGASSGIGKALTDSLSASNHSVVRIARSFPTTSPDNLEFHCDVSDWQATEAVALALTQKWDHVDALICCAAIQGEIQPTLESNPAEWETTIRINLLGTYHCLRAFAPLLKKAPRRAKVICFSGGGATNARPGFSSYAASKTAVVRLVETVAAETLDSPFDINAIAPGAIPTAMTDAIIAAGPEKSGRKEYESALALKQSQSNPIEKVEALVTWLLSSKSDGISGRLLSAVWDNWNQLNSHALKGTDTYTLRRVLP